mgnify:CR=1 FL=1
MARFNFWQIKVCVADGVRVKGFFHLIPYDDLDEEEKAWVWLLRTGQRDQDRQLTETDIDKTDSLTNYNLTVYNERKEVTDDDVNHLATMFEQKNSMTETEIKNDNVMITEDMINRTMIDFPSMLRLMVEDGCERHLVQSFKAMVMTRPLELSFGVSYVKKTDIDKQLKNLTSPEKKKMTDDEKRKIIKKREEMNLKIAIEMGLGDQKAPIGDLMLKLRESCAAECNEKTMGLEEMELMIQTPMELNSMVEFVRQIDVKLAVANNAGVRLVNLRGQIFGLYAMVNPNATTISTAEVFGVSSYIVSTSRAFSELIAKYPTLRWTTLPFTTIVRNMKRIRDWMAESSIDDK